MKSFLVAQNEIRNESKTNCEFENLVSHFGMPIAVSLDDFIERAIGQFNDWIQFDRESNRTKAAK